ncbi:MULTISPECIES: hypothetical protein [Vibrio]|nr:MULTISPECIES: hypothetical protein [Vibrio]MDV5060911.1 hypothetical protein [Vibrio diabolicus]
MSTELKFALSIAGGFFTIGVVAIIMVSRYAMMAVWYLCNRLKVVNRKPRLSRGFLFCLVCKDWLD